MPGKGARSGGLNIPYDSIERVEQFLFFFLAAAPSRGARRDRGIAQNVRKGSELDAKIAPGGHNCARETNGHKPCTAETGSRQDLITVLEDVQGGQRLSIRVSFITAPSMTTPAVNWPVRCNVSHTSAWRSSAVAANGPRVHSSRKGFDGHAASPRNLIAAVSTGSPRSSGAAAHVVRALSCEFSGFGGLGASALSFQLRGFALCQLGPALAPGLASRVALRLHAHSTLAAQVELQDVPTGNPWPSTLRPRFVTFQTKFPSERLFQATRPSA